MLDFERMAKLIKEISVFFPAYNLESQIKDTIENAFKIIPKISDKYEIIVINDGSKDQTGEVISRLKSKYKNLVVITHKVNRGYGGALKSGFYNAKYQWIAFTDADGQFDIKELPILIRRQKETDAGIVAGFYLKRAVSWQRKLNTWVWQLIVRMLFGLQVKDIDCGFKLVRKKVIDVIPKLESERGAFISSEFLIKAQRSKFKIVEVGVHHYSRTEGKGTGADLNVVIKSFVDLFKLYRDLRTS